MIAFTEKTAQDTAPGARRQSGQTLIIAMIIMGLLLILGFVFLGIVDRNIRGSAFNQTRSAANDLAEAGIRYAHGQLVDGPLGADWRGTPVTLTLAPNNPNNTLDPDAYYLRPSSGLNWPGTTRVDLGGPDGEGPFIRVPFDQGRALIRVRLALSDANMFQSSPTGPLRSPGEVHSLLQIESIGRLGVVNTNDPTTLASGSGVQIQGFASVSQLAAALGQMQQFDSQFANSRHLLAFDTTGIGDFARFITNKFSVSRAADIGVPNPTVTVNGQSEDLGVGVGVTYSPNGSGDVDLGTILSYQLGTSGSIPGAGIASVPNYGGSFMSNADVTIHGNVDLYLNSFLGEKFQVNGNIVGDDNAQLQINLENYSPTTGWSDSATTLASSSFTSRSTTYTTFNGSILDGAGGSDQAGYSRGVGRLVPPTALQQDPQTRETRYLELTRESGVLSATTGVNGGEYGHGQGVYVSNGTDLQTPIDEAGRIAAGGSESLFNDWTNPNNGDKTSGWQGPYYNPVGAYVQLRSDGFLITLDNNQTWKNPDGSDSGQNSLRFRIGANTHLPNNPVYIVDGLETPGTINSASPDFTQGQPFNGVLYFDGNVRVRGEIPTDVQMTVVSGGTIYIEGAITKGIHGNDVTDNQQQGSTFYAAYGAALTRPSKSMLMLMAKDNVAVNTSQFLGTGPGQSLQVVSDQQNDTGYDPIRISANAASNGGLTLSSEELTDPTTGNSTNPSTWQPYSLNYVDSLVGDTIPKSILLTHTMDSGTGAASFISMYVNYGSYADTTQNEAYYYFPGSPSGSAPANSTPTSLGYFPGFDNTASDYLFASNVAGYWGSLDMYGLGHQPWQQYTKFEGRGFHLIYPGGSTTYNNGLITSSDGATTDPFIQYALNAPGTNTYQIWPNHIPSVPSNDYLLARASLVPHDIRIEASVFAEEGSFYIIPGPWTNPNPNDTRDAYEASLGTNPTVAQVQQAAENRLESYGNGPEVPFYGEPIDVRVQIVGSVSENMPPSLALQTASVQKWGWIPVQLAGMYDANSGTQLGIPLTHNPLGTGNTSNVVPNCVISYDPELATGRIDGFSSTNSSSGWIRTDAIGRALSPMPRLPVSPVPVYFGEIQ
jgi:hypothetical protein